MKQFNNVVRELRIWLTSFSWINSLMPVALYIMFGGLGLVLLNTIIITVFYKYLAVFSMLSTIGHFAFLLGFWITLISAESKWVPYALFVKAFIMLFPFTSFSLYGVISAIIDVFFGYQLLRYTAYVSSNRE